MKSTTLLLATIALVPFNACCTRVAADTPGAPTAYETSIVLGAKSILPFEPLLVAVVFKNVGGDRRTVRSIQMGYVAVTVPDARNIVVCGPWDGMPCAPPIAVDTVLESGQQIWSVIDICVDQGACPVLAKSGWYSLTGKYLDMTNEPFRVVMSKPQFVRVVQPDGDDAAAYAYLLEHPLYKYFGQNAQWRMASDGDAKVANELKTFAKTFPKSRYAAWAQLALCIMPLGDASYSQTTVSSGFEQVASATKVAEVRSRAWYYAATCYRRRYPNADVDMAKAGDGDAVISAEIEHEKVIKK